MEVLDFVRIFIPELVNNFENKNGEYTCEGGIEDGGGPASGHLCPNRRLHVGWVEARARREMEEWEVLSSFFGIYLYPVGCGAAGKPGVLSSA